MREYARMLSWLFTVQAGLSVGRVIRVLRGLPRYGRDYRTYASRYAGTIRHRPCVLDWSDAAGSTSGEYFGQDLFVAQRIFQKNPRRHVDIGSRIDGFVAHVASFRTIEVIDIRPIATRIPNVVFKQADFTDETAGLAGYCDSVSCLHALEHFGLGRYGDAVDVEGFSKGFTNLARMVKPGGALYLSLPLGRECVMFNAHRITNPLALRDMALANDLAVEAFAFWENGRMVDAGHIDSELERISGEAYVLGVFVFRRVHES